MPRTGTASLPLLRIPLAALALPNTPPDFAPVVELPTSLAPPRADVVTAPSDATPVFWQELPPELLDRRGDDQRESFLRFWDVVLPYVRRIDFALDTAGWASSAIEALSVTPITRTCSPHPN